MRDNLPNMLRAAAKEWREENKVVATGATRYDAALDEAADAIEELSNPRWIPVTETLPKTRESILGKKSSSVIVAFRFDDGTQGTSTAHTLNGEWVFEDHITVVARTITHWMPLPQPPQESNQ